MEKDVLILRQQRRLQSARVPLAPRFESLYAPLLVAIAYYLGAQAAFAIGTLSDRIFAPFWPPNIVLFCTLLLVPKRRWWLFIASALPAHLLAELTVAMPLAQSLVAFITNCILAVLSASLMLRFVPRPSWFGTLKQTAIYIGIAAVLSPAIAAFGGAFVQMLSGGSRADDYWTFWGNWWIANALGSVTLGPAFLIWFAPRMEDEAPFTLRRKTEGVILAVFLAAVCAIAFHADSRSVNSGFLPAVLYSPLPLILWAAIRFGERGSSGAILLVTVVAISENLRTSTVFIGIDPGKSVLALQIFLLGIAIPIFFLGTAIDELRRSGEVTRKLAGALLRAQDEERRRIARELHDSTGQNLAMAHLMTDQIQSQAPTGAKTVSELKEILQTAMTEIRTISYLLHPPLLDVGGLRLAVQSYVDGFSKRTGIRVDLELSPDLGRIASDVELVLFRVIQEALTNVWRHSGSKTAQIQLVRQVSRGDPRIMLTIKDAGKGIPNDIDLSMSKSRRLPSGLGLMGMRERLHQVGGQLEIDSTSGKTVIRAIVTLDQETAEARA